MLREDNEAFASLPKHKHTDDSDADASPSDAERRDNAGSKRKRDDAPELEIDVDLPEPPSKKAQRKAKKQKPARPMAPNETAVADGAVSGNVPDDKSKDPPPTTKRSQHGIWIGNLAFTVTKALLQQFFTSADTGIALGQIKRIHMPAPKNAAATKTTLKPQNKGFAYVDFDNEQSLEAAIKLSESEFAGRKVLIKDAKNFEGRPDSSKEIDGKHGSESAQTKSNKPPCKRVFVGNLSFDVTKEDLLNHFKQCGEVEYVHMATFEDSGKCKGFAWVTFVGLDAAEAAVRGWVMKKDDDQERDSEESDDAHKEEDGAAEPKRKRKDKKGRKWFVNRLFGRPLRCEFAEDPSVRYRKRFGKEKDTANEDPEGQLENTSQSRKRHAGAQDRLARGVRSGHAEDVRINPGAPTDPTKRRGRGRHGDAVGFKANDEYKSNEEIRYRTGGITAGTGTRTTFE